jgi:hypothetical protein
MSFRLFIYYCALCGGWAALVAWSIGRPLKLEDHPIWREALKGMALGMLVALALGLVDALWNLSLRRYVQVGVRVLLVVTVGCIGGLIGGAMGQALYGSQGGDSKEQEMFQLLVAALLYILGWTFTGLLIGASLGVFDILASVVRPQEARGAVRKIVKGLIGGTLGGLLGGILAVVLKLTLFQDKPKDELWSPSAIGFVVLGLCIGLLIGLAQVILREAWIRVEAGFRPGRELILSKGETTIGRAESCDIGLFGDNGIERLHARILLEGGGYVVTDAGSAGGTFLNGEPVTAPTPLHSGDAIQVGKSVLRFQERYKRSE